MRNKTINLYTEWRPLIESLPDDDAGKIFKFIYQYQDGEDVNSNHAIWKFIQKKLDDFNEKGKEISETRRELGRKGGLAKASNSQVSLANLAIKEKKIKQNNIKEKKEVSKRAFAPPTLEEVKSYAEERKRTDLVSKFFDFYTAGDWKDTKGNQVKSWKQKFLTWEGRDSPPPEKAAGTGYGKFFSMSEKEKQEYLKGKRQ